LQPSLPLVHGGAMTLALSTVFNKKGLLKRLGALLALYAFWKKFIRPRIRISLKGRIVIITGCGGGIGSACVRKFLAEGAIVFAGVRRQASIDEWEAYKQQRGSNSPGELVPIMLDVTKDEQVEEAVKAVEQRGAPVAALVNNAGVSAFGFVECLPLERYKQCMEANYLGTVRVTKAFLPLLRRDRGRMVMVGSAGDRNPAGFGSAYLSSKAAVAWFTECLRQEMARFGVLVPLVEPGFFASGLLNSGASNGKKESAGMAEQVYGNHDAMMTEVRKPIEFAERLNGGPEGMEKACGGAVVEAACARWPLARNVVGIDANLILRWVPYLPTSLLDFEFAMRHRRVHPAV